MKRELIAYHEAGHIVAALAVGVRPMKATISPGNGFLGRVNYGPRSRAKSVITGWGGGMGAAWGVDKFPCVETMQGTSDTDLESTKDIKDTADRKELGALLMAVHIIALINKDAISFFAKALLERGSLTDKDIQRLRHRVRVNRLSFEIIKIYIETTKATLCPVTAFYDLFEMEIPVNGWPPEGE